MSGVATAIVGGAVVGAVITGNAAKGAAQTQADAANNATAAQQSMFNTQVANQQPYMDAGYKALDQIQANMPSYNQPFTMGMFQQDPGYQFDLQQGEQAIQNSAAASGHLVSSQQLGNASTYAQNMASNEFGNAFNRYQTQQSASYNRLASLAQLGQAGVSDVNKAGTNAATNIGNNMIGAGNVSAAGQVGTANAITGGINTATSGLMNYNMMNSLMPQQPNPGYGGGGMASMSGSQSLQMPTVGQSAGYGGGTTPINSLY